jgi:hypothetical protein
VDGIQGFTFYDAGVKQSDCNKNVRPSDAMNPLILDPLTQKLSPVTQVFRQFKYGDKDNPTTNTIEPDLDVSSLNADVRSRLKSANSIWQNYFLLGAVWIDDPKTKFAAGAGNFEDDVLKGERRLSNSTVETFTQRATAMLPLRSNCFRCHATGPESQSVNGVMLNLPAQKINVIHVLLNAFFHR